MHQQLPLLVLPRIPDPHIVGPAEVIDKMRKVSTAQIRLELETLRSFHPQRYANLVEFFISAAKR